MTVSRLIEAMLQDEERSRTVLALAGVVGGVLAVVVSLLAGLMKN